MGYNNARKYLQEVRDMIDDLEEQVDADVVNAEDAGFWLGYTDDI